MIKAARAALAFQPVEPTASPTLPPTI